VKHRGAVPIGVVCALLAYFRMPWRDQRDQRCLKSFTS
jgi:hypothetical protein